LHKVDWLFVFSCADHNLIRLSRFIGQTPTYEQGKGDIQDVPGAASAAVVE
jgi:hypothetical protein